MSTTRPDTVESLTAKAFGLISTAQRNGMSASDAVSVGIRPFLEELLSLRERADKLLHALTSRNAELSEAERIVREAADETAEATGMTFEEFARNRVHILTANRNSDTAST